MIVTYDLWFKTSSVTKFDPFRVLCPPHPHKSDPFRVLVLSPTFKR